METVFLKLVHIMLRFLEAFSSQDAFALLMNLEHMKLGLFPGPPENGLEDVSDIIHKIDRIVPANNEIPGLEAGFWLFLCCLDGAWQQLWNGCLCHKRTLKEETLLVEPSGADLNCGPRANPANLACGYRHRTCSVTKKSEHSGVQFVEVVLLLGTFGKD
jgi:hypothetical protein